MIDWLLVPTLPVLEDSAIVPPETMALLVPVRPAPAEIVTVVELAVPTAAASDIAEAACSVIVEAFIVSPLATVTLPPDWISMELVVAPPSGALI